MNGLAYEKDTRCEILQKVSWCFRARFTFNKMIFTSFLNFSHFSFGNQQKDFLWWCRRAR